MNRGSKVATTPVQPRPAASMRPRFMNRGSQRGVDRVAAAAKASMRPRFMNRGSPDWARIRPDPHELQ